MSVEPEVYFARPVSIEAMKYDKNNPVETENLVHWIMDTTQGFIEWDHYHEKIEKGEEVPTSGFVGKYTSEGEEIHIITLEGLMHVSDGDYVIKGLAGEFYPCKPDIFHQKYYALGEEDEV